ncbi:hypothetical protein [Streptomyces sp. A5-4]|uniref:hypothetical protein n=1 Tax=Streptomyces sp. A5-4 TaxID=3384771 RepID=UPI003DA969E5
MPLAPDLPLVIASSVWGGVPQPLRAAAPADAAGTFVTALTRRRAEQAATCPPERRTEREGQLRSAMTWHRFHTRART